MANSHWYLIYQSRMIPTVGARSLMTLGGSQQLLVADFTKLLESTTMSRTTITVDEETRNRLFELKTPGDSYDDVLRRELLDDE